MPGRIGWSNWVEIDRFNQAGIQCNLNRFPPNSTSQIGRIGWRSIEMMPGQIGWKSIEIMPGRIGQIGWKSIEIMPGRIGWSNWVEIH